MERKTYYENEDFRIYLEEIQEQVFIHVVIKNFSKGILDDIKAVWAEILIKMYFLGYEYLFTYTKDNRIVNMIGNAQKVGTHKQYEVWRWELN